MPAHHRNTASPEPRPSSLPTLLTQELQWLNGSRIRIRGTWVNQGTHPPGSVWAMNPIPRIDFDSASSGQPASYRGCTRGNDDEPYNTPGYPASEGCRQFKPPCEADHGWHAQPPFKASIDVEGPCSGDWTGTWQAGYDMRDQEKKIAACQHS